MKRLKDLLGSVAAAIYLIFPMSLVLILFLFMPIVFLSDVNTIRISGFAGPSSAVSFIGFCGLFIGVSMLVPPLRKIYRALPWLYSFITIFYVDFIILNIAEAILNYGYEVNNAVRHKTFFILMIIQIIICRIAMCFYFSKKDVRHFKR